MFSFEKTDKTFPELESKLSYDSWDIYNQIISDSFGKCYLCGEKQDTNRSPRVEHFVPHESGKYEDKKFDWKNLFFSCDHCNNRKSSTYNKIGSNKDILNPTIDKIEEEVLHYYNVYSLDENIVELNNLTGSDKADNTIELLEKIYNEDIKNKTEFAKASKSHTLKNNISNEMFEFLKLIKELGNNPMVDYHRDKICQEIKEHLSNESNFYEFKLGHINKHPKAKELLEEYSII